MFIDAATCPFYGRQACSETPPTSSTSCTASRRRSPRSVGSRPTEFRRYCCAVSWAEIFAGVRLGEEGRTEAFFDARAGITLDAITGRRAGEYLSRYSGSRRAA